MKPICAVFAIPLLLLGSCRTTGPAPEQNVYAESVSRPALERRLARGELAIGITQTPDSEKELQEVSGILARKNFKLKVLHASRAELPPLLRSGKVDLIAGKFSEKEIMQLQLVPVFLAPDGKTPRKNGVLAIRRGNPELEKILNESPVNTEKKENVRMDRKTQN